MLRFRYLILLCLFFPVIIQISSRDRLEVSAEDLVDDDTEDVAIDADEDNNVLSDDEDESSSSSSKSDADDEDDDGTLKPSPHAYTTMLFTKPLVPDMQNVELPAAKLISYVIGFVNNGDRDFHLQTTEATLRYPQDLSYVIQNYSAVPCEITLSPRQQASIHYTFMVAESLSARPFWLVVDVHYRDSNGRQYLSPVFNQTVQIVEDSEGLNGETFFLYVTLLALLLLALFAVHRLLFSNHVLGKRRRVGGGGGGGGGMADSSGGGGGGSNGVERGTAGNRQLDYDWLPATTLKSANSPKISPRQSPRLRKNRAQ